MSDGRAGVWLHPLPGEQEGSQAGERLRTARAGTLTLLPKATEDARFDGGCDAGLLFAHWLLVGEKFSLQATQYRGLFYPLHRLSSMELLFLLYSLASAYTWVATSFLKEIESEIHLKHDCTVGEIRTTERDPGKHRENSI
ncbi:hypothetical protein DNTS_005895 [Danionella cerebrum]|uniref:Uncharacterized protein n=1 Tax=Danionella cerebrum TaxID=2873325 RepID=A0A553R8Y2_9TELE|nr:hypothetical protein DNTS_005895 [Danionella translucida]